MYKISIWHLVKKKEGKKCILIVRNKNNAYRISFFFLATERHNDNKDTDLNMLIIQDHDNIPINYLISEIPFLYPGTTTVPIFVRVLKRKYTPFCLKKFRHLPVYFISQWQVCHSQCRDIFPCQCNSVKNVWNNLSLTYQTCP